MHRRSKWLVLVVLLAYALFASGFVFEITKSVITDRIDTPYSFSFSQHRINLIGIQNSDDIAAAEWLAKTEDIPIQTDYNGALLIYGYGLYNRYANLDYMEKRFVFVTAWSEENGKWSVGNNGGTRTFRDLSQYDHEVFRSGNTIVYVEE